MTILIRGGTVVTADEAPAGADVLVEGERVRAIGRSGGGFDAPGARVIDATGCLVVPGGVDAHTHLDSPQSGTISSDDFHTGTVAAAVGGTTTVIDFANQEPGRTVQDALEIWQAKAQGKAVVDYGFHVIVTRLGEADLPAVDHLIREGVTSLKLFMATGLGVDDATILRTLERAGAGGGMCCVHAENGAVVDLMVARALAAGRGAPRWHGATRPVLAEAEAAHRAIVLAELADAPVYLVHLSTGEAVAEVAAARERGRPVFAETCPHYLVLDDSRYVDDPREAAKYVISPPLRPAGQAAALWSALSDGRLQAVNSDHCTFCLDGQRDRWLDDFSGMPNGGPGIEHRLSLVYSEGVATGRFGLRRWVELCSAGPARLFGLWPAKGTIAPGSDADLVVFDPAAEQTVSATAHHMNIDYSIYEGMRLTGAVRTVLSRGEVIVDREARPDGTFGPPQPLPAARPGRGRYLHRGPSGRP
jgi:dihydropyrimidinase